MIRPLFSSLALPVLAVLGLAACSSPQTETVASTQASTTQYSSLFGEMPTVVVSADNAITEAKVDLGRVLYFEPRMSANGEIACNSCHALDRYGVDGLATSPGHDGTLGGRNSPTVYNAAIHISQFWDGREPNVEAQAKGPILNPVEHGMTSAEAVEEVLRGIPGYRPLFEAAFPGQDEAITFDNVALAIGAFERKLVTHGNWDSWLSGNASALTTQEQRGVDVFVETGCIACHAGPALGGSMYQKLGLVEAYATQDKGRAAITGNASDEYLFKVPGLRLISETGPYLHDGSIESLEEVVRLMAKHQLGKTLDEAQMADLLAFMKVLTGELPNDYIARPELPESPEA